jgi:lipopolysaccharide heptosyltransferase II
MVYNQVVETKARYKRILIINPFGIGDVIFTMPVIESIKTKYPEAYIGYVCNIRTAPILFSNPNIDKVFIFERDEYRQLWQLSKAKAISKIWNLLRDVKKESFNIVLDFSMARDYGFFSMLSGIRRRIGYNYNKRGLFLTDKIPLKAGYCDKHVIDYHKQFLLLMDLDLPMDTMPKVYIAEEDDKKAQQILWSKDISLTDKYICIMPGAGASWGATAYRKQWPASKFAEVASMLVDESGIKIILLGSADDKELCDRVEKAVPAAINLCGKLSLMVSNAIIRHASVLLTNDGGPLHMAVAVGTNTVSIFGPVDEKVYGPYLAGDGHIVITNDIACRPCYNSFKLPACEDIECLNGIGSDEVVKAVEVVMGGRV